MQRIKILYMFPKLLSLYGEYGNISVLRRTLENRGFAVEIISAEEDFDFSQEYSLIYTGSGTEENLCEALKRLSPFLGEIKNAAQAGRHFLITGNAPALFGKTLEYRKKIYPAAGIFLYDSIMSDKKRYMGDVITNENNIFGKKSIGFVNTSCVYEGADNPLFEFNLNARLGNDKSSCADGSKYKNVYATQLIGPLLVKNPHILLRLCSEITQTDFSSTGDSFIFPAYSLAVGELSRRLKNA